MLEKNKRHPGHGSMGSFGDENTDNEKKQKNIRILYGGKTLKDYR